LKSSAAAAEQIRNSAAVESKPRIEPPVGQQAFADAAP
jgi:hypothetical protein